MRLLTSQSISNVCHSKRPLSIHKSSSMAGRDRRITQLILPRIWLWRKQNLHKNTRNGDNLLEPSGIKRKLPFSTSTSAANLLRETTCELQCSSLMSRPVQERSFGRQRYVNLLRGPTSKVVSLAKENLTRLLFTWLFLEELTKGPENLLVIDDYLADQSSRNHSWKTLGKMHYTWKKPTMQVKLPPIPK